MIAASAASQFGDWLYNAALLGYVYAATGSASWVGAATICRLLPYALLGPVGGVIADRFDRRAVLLAGDILRSAVMLALAAVVATDGPVAVVIGLTALASAAGTAERPAAMALLPRLVGESRIGTANALLHTVQDVGVIAGPAAGALLIAVAPDELAFVANAATFAVSALFVSRIRRSTRTAQTSDGEGAGSLLRQGLTTARRTPFVVPLLVVVAMAEFTYGAQTVQLVLYAERLLDLGDGGYGYLLALAGIGGVMSAAVNARLSSSPRVSVIVVGAGAAFCVSQLVYAATGQIVLATVATVVGGAGVVVCEVVAETAVARIVPGEVLGRVMGVFDALSVAAMVLGALVAPLLIETVSLRASFTVLGLVALGLMLVCLGPLRPLDDVSRERARVLASKVATIEALPLTAGAPLLVLEQLASASQTVPLPPGVDVVVEGAPAHAFYVVLDGSVVVHRGGTEVARLGPGDFFGERGLLDAAPRNATVTTAVDTELLRLEGDVLVDALRSAPSVRSALDLPRTAPGSVAVHEPTPLVDDPTWTPDTDRADPVGIPAVSVPVRDVRHGSAARDSVAGATVVVVGAGYAGKRRALARMAALGARLVVVDEEGHWSEALVGEGIAERWRPVRILGRPDEDADAVLDALAADRIEPDGVITFWEDSVCVAARVATRLGLPTNPVESVDAVRSKLVMRATSAALGLPTPRAQRVRSLDELIAAAAVIGFPAVVKPEFGASAMGCVRVDDMASLPSVYTAIRRVVNPEHDGIFRAGNDLLLEQYLDGVEFDVDLVMHDGRCLFSSVSQNWPTAEPSFQETGLHIPPDHDRREVAQLVDLAIRTVQGFGLGRGVLHVEGKCTSRGPRIIEVNARVGGGRIDEMVMAVWGVDLVAAQLHSCLDLVPPLAPSRKPQCAVVDAIIHAPASGRLVSLPLPAAVPDGCLSLDVDVDAAVGERVDGPEEIFATVLAELTIAAKNLDKARALADRLLAEPPMVEPDSVDAGVAPHEE